eukprot:gene6160-biopygen4136
MFLARVGGLANSATRQKGTLYHTRLQFPPPRSPMLGTEQSLKIRAMVLAAVPRPILLFPPSFINGAPAPSFIARVVAFISCVIPHSNTRRWAPSHACVGEVGENIRAAVRGAFGISDGAPFQLLDADGHNVVLGHASVVDGDKYTHALNPSTATR